MHETTLLAVDYEVRSLGLHRGDVVVIDLDNAEDPVTLARSLELKLPAIWAAVERPGAGEPASVVAIRTGESRTKAGKKLSRWLSQEAVHDACSLHAWRTVPTRNQRLSFRGVHVACTGPASGAGGPRFKSGRPD
jgi:hypothetical protein